MTFAPSKTWFMSLPPGFLPISRMEPIPLSKTSACALVPVVLLGRDANAMGSGPLLITNTDLLLTLVTPFCLALLPRPRREIYVIRLVG